MEITHVELPTTRVPGQVCDRCRRRKIRCHGDGEECSPCYVAGVVCVTSAKLKRNRKRKSYYESEGIEQRRPELMPKTQAQGQPQPPPVYNDSDPVSDFRGAPASQSDLQLRPSPSAIAQTGYEPVGSQASPAPYRGEALPNPTGNLASGRENAGEPKQTSDPVIGHMGRLVSDDRQIAMFAGSSTGVHFISQAEQQLQMLRMHTETFPSSAYSMHLHDIWGTSTRPTGTTLAQSLTARLPTNATEILEATIDRWTPIYPIVHKPSMIEASRQLLSGGTVPDAVSTVLLYQLLALLALGTIGLSGGCVQDHYHFLCQSDGYYGMTTVLLDQILGKPCLQSLQGLEITQIYLQLTSRYSSALHLGGIATRLAQNLGLHRHSNRFKFDPLETELRRRVWWCQYSLDAFSSAYHGMPRLIRDQDVDTDLPTRVDHDLLSRSHVAFPLPGEATQVDTALLLFKLSRIVGQTMEKLYTTTQRRGGVSKITRLQAELDMWERSLPTDQPGDTGEDMADTRGKWPEAVLPTTFLRAALCVASVHIHRPALSFTTANQQFQKSLGVCCRSSASLISLLSDGLNSFPLPSPSAGSAYCPDALLITLLYPNGAHMLWQAGLTLLFARWKGHPLRSADGDDDGLVQRCVSALHNVHAATGNAGGDDVLQCAEVLEVLRGKTFSGVTATPRIEPDQLQWNVWDWPMASALELANTLEVMPLDLYLAGYDDSIAGKSYHDDTKRLNEALLPHLDQGRTVIAVAHSYGVVPLSHAVNGQTVAERASRGLTGGFVSFLFIAPSPFIQAGLSMYQFAGNQWLTLSLHYLEETTLPLKLEKAKEAFYADLDQYARDEAGSQLCNQSRAPFEATIECTPAEINIPKKFILTTIDAAYPREVQEEMAKKWGATILGGIESGHSPWVKKENLAKLVELVVQEAAEY